MKTLTLSEVFTQGNKFTAFFLPAVVFIALSIQVPSCSVGTWEQSKSSVFAGGGVTKVHIVQ